MSAELQRGQCTDAIQVLLRFLGKTRSGPVVLESGLRQLMPHLVTFGFEIPFVVFVDGADDGDLVGDG